MLIRDAEQADLAAVGDLRLAAYQAGGHLTADSGYAPHLRALGADGLAQVLVALAAGEGEAGGQVNADGQPGPAHPILGTVMLQFWPDTGPTVAGPHEAEVRALAVRPGAQGGGIGWALVRAVIDRAGRAGIEHLVLCTQPDMRAAHRLYERAGFLRLPERDWSPAPGVSLLVYGLKLG